MTEEQWHLLYFYFFCLKIRFKKHVFFCELAFLKSNHDSTLDVCEWNSKKMYIPICWSRGQEITSIKLWGACPLASCVLPQLDQG